MLSKDEITGVVRTVIAALAGALLSKLNLDAQTITGLAASLTTVGVAIWSVWAKRNAKANPPIPSTP
jgi:hypothetical protein